MTILLGLALAFAAIIIGAELFTNALEWLGFHLGFGDGPIGSVFAAVGTALPETTIPVIAIGFGGGAHASDVGLGAILGAPFMLSTVGLALTGGAVVLFSRRRANGVRVAVDTSALGHDLGYFLVAYAIALAAAILLVGVPWVKRLVGLALLGLYVAHVRHHLRAGGSTEVEVPPPLRLQRGRGPITTGPGLPLTNAQLLIGLACVVLGAYYFVDAIGGLNAVDVSPLLVSLFVAPIATELPEATNSILWVRRGRDQLAIGNITGAMVFQSAIPTAIALLLAPGLWAAGLQSGEAFASAALALLVAAAVAMIARSRQLHAGHLALGGFVYVGYLLAVVNLF